MYTKDKVVISILVHQFIINPFYLLCPPHFLLVISKLVFHFLMDDMVGVRLGVLRPVLQGEENLRWVSADQVNASSRYNSIFNEMTVILIS